MIEFDYGSRFVPAPNIRETLIVPAIGAQLRSQGNGQTQVVFFNADGQQRGARPATALEIRMWELLIAADDNALGSVYFGSPNGTNMNGAPTTTGG